MAKGTLVKVWDQERESAVHVPYVLRWWGAHEILTGSVLPGTREGRKFSYAEPMSPEEVRMVEDER